MGRQALGVASVTSVSRVDGPIFSDFYLWSVFFRTTSSISAGWSMFLLLNPTWKEPNLHCRFRSSAGLHTVRTYVPTYSFNSNRMSQSGP